MKVIFNRRFFAIAAIILLSFTPPGKDKRKRKFIDPANMDLSVKPGDNFFKYANGNWVKNNAVPASKTRWGGFDQLAQQNIDRLHQLLEDASHNASIDPKFKKIADYYASGMDSAAIEALGYQPIKSDLERVSGLKTIQDLLEEMSYERVKGIGGAVTAMFVAQDRKNVTKYIPTIGQGGTTLPDRDYYLKNDARSVNVRKEFLTHISNAFQLVGINATQAVLNANAILGIETALAKAQMPRVEMRDPYKLYNKFS